MPHHYVGVVTLLGKGKHKRTLDTAPLSKNLISEALEYGTHFRGISQVLTAHLRIYSRMKWITHASAFQSETDPHLLAPEG